MFRSGLVAFKEMKRIGVQRKKVKRSQRVTKKLFTFVVLGGEFDPDARSPPPG